MQARFGASGTTANTFIYILWGCLRKPEVVGKLKDELRTAFPDRTAIPDYLVRKLARSISDNVLIDMDTDLQPITLSSSRHQRDTPTVSHHHRNASKDYD